MKNPLLLNVERVLTALCLLVASSLTTAMAGPDDLLPKPQQMVLNGNETFVLGRAVQLSDPSNCAYLRTVLENYGCTLGETAQAQVTVDLVTSISGAFNHQVNLFPDEAYQLDITTDAIHIQALTPTGVIRAAQTLNQLAEGTDEGGTASLQASTIKDWPAFKVRGFMHDVGRSFIPFDELKNEIDKLARFKVNVFHWHLTEKLAWRFEVKAYPQLTADENMIRYAGDYYTQEQCRELEAYAAERGVTVIPEIDMPGHSDVFTNAMGFSMQTDEGVEALKKILDEVVEVFPNAPYIHIGGDEVRITYTDFLKTMADYVRGKGKKVVMWNRLVAGPPTAEQCDMTQMWATSGKVVSGLPNIDCRYNYTNHFDVYADLVGIYKSNIYYTQQGTDDVAGTISAAWCDTKTESWQDIVRQNNIYANILASAERAWCGGGQQYVEVGGTTLPNSGAEFEEFADFERRFLFHKAHSLQNEPISYVKQTNVHWRITDPFPNNGDKTMQFPPELLNEDENGVLPTTFTYNGQEYGSKIATGAGIYLRHIWHSTIPSWFSNPAYGQTAYAWTYVYSPVAQTVGAQVEFYTYSRSGSEKAPPAGEWDRRGSKLWVNGEEIAAPTWDQPDATIPQDNATQGLKNENLTARPVTPITLQAGWNKVMMRLPHAAASGTGRDKWQFTFVLTDAEGKNALDNIVYSPSKVKGESALQLDLLIDEISAYLRTSFSDKVGYYPLAMSASLSQLVEEVRGTMGQELDDAARTQQLEDLTTAYAQLKADVATATINQPQVSNEEEEHYYTLCTPLRGNRYTTDKGENTAIQGETSVSDASKWKFTLRSDNTYNIINAESGRYISPASNNNTALQAVTAEPASGWSVKPSNELGYVIITSGSVQFNQTNSAPVYNWGGGSNTSDTGCKFVFAEVEYTPVIDEPDDVVETIISSTATLRNDKVYVIKSGCSNNTTSYYLLYHKDAPGNLSSTYGSGYTSIPFDEATPNYQFAIYKFGDSFYCYNMAAGKFVGTVSGDGLAIPIIEIPNAPLLIRASENATYNFVLSCNNGDGLLNAARKGGVNGLCNWEAGKDNFTATTNIYQIITAGDLTADMQRAIAQKIAASKLMPAMEAVAHIGTGVGKYAYSGSVSLSETLAAAESLMHGTTIPTQAEVEACIANLNTIAAQTGAINQPERRRLYRFRCAANNKWLTSATDANGMVQMAADNGPETLFYLDEAGRLLSYTTGQYTGDMSATPKMKLFGIGTAEASLKAFTFRDVYALASADASKLGRYGLQVNGRNIYGSFSDGLVNSGSSGGSITGDAGYQWFVEEVTEVPVFVNSTYGLGTFYSPVPLAASADESYGENERLKFFTAKLDDDSYVTLSQHSGDIPAETPFVIELAAGADYDADNGCVYMAIASEAPAEVDPASYSLQGSLVTQAYAAPADEAEITTYTLQLPSSGNTDAATPLVFRKFNGTKLQGCRAYLVVPAGTPLMGMRFEDGVQTAIGQMPQQEQAAEAVYDLTGRRVQSPQRGLYIVNGKKKLVK